jgi:hypothetical protein
VLNLADIGDCEVSECYHKLVMGSTPTRCIDVDIYCGLENHTDRRDANVLDLLALGGS